MDRQRVPHHPPQDLLDLVLHGPLVRLPLPPAEVSAVVSDNHFNGPLAWLCLFVDHAYNPDVMPANLTPDYLEAEQRYRQAKTPAEKLEALEEMLRTIPKHKGTSKIQGELKRKISEAKEAAQTAKKGGGGGFDPFAIPRQGAGQVIVIGTPNTGKSSIVGAITKATVKIAEWPFTTPTPVPGMCHHEDVPIQMIDTPPLTAEQAPTGLAGAVYSADIVLIVLDASAGSILEDAETCLNFVKARKLVPTSEPNPTMPEDYDGPRPKRCLILANKADLPDASDNIDVLKEMLPDAVTIKPCSATTGEGVTDLPTDLFNLLHVMRVYAKPPGKPADMTAPFILEIGSNILDMAGVVHRDLPEKLKTARVWGTGVHDGQQVQKDHVLHDKDIVELHS